MKTGKKLLTIGVFLVFLSTMALANGLNLNSIGSRAMAMGGAFVGLADDFSTAYWNPAGMAQFTKKTFGFYGSDVIPSQSYKFDMLGMTLVDAQTPTKHYFSGMGAYYHPINEKLVVGVSVYVPSGLGASWNGADFSLISSGQTYKWESLVGLVTFAPGLAYKVSDAFMIGATFNVNYALFDMYMHTGEAMPPPWTVDLGQRSMEFTGWGYGATIGVLVKPSDKFSLGITYRTPVKVKFSGTSKVSNFSGLSPFVGFTVSNSSDTDVEITWPMWLAFGVAFKPIEKLTITADYQYTDWKTIDVAEMQFTDQSWQIMVTQQGKNKLPFHWKSRAQIRFGAEYWVSQKLALRGGYYWDPAPAPDSTMNVLLPNFDFNVITFGVGYKMNGLQIDVAIEHLLGADRDIAFDLTGEQDSMPGLHKMKIWAVSTSLGYGW